MPYVIRVPRVLGLLFLVMVWRFAAAGPLAPASVPDSLRGWIPWALHSQAALACPRPAEGEGERQCVWPAVLDLDLLNTGGRFRLELQVQGKPALVPLPGSVELWPQNVRQGTAAVPVIAREGRPHIEVAAGSVVITGDLPWRERPQELQLPPELGVVVVKIDGRTTPLQPDRSGRLTLRDMASSEAGEGAESLRVSRLLTDSIPFSVETRIELSVGGKAREVPIAAALLPGFEPELIRSPLATHLVGDQLVVQARPGNWVIELRARSARPVQTLGLPKELGRPEVWAFAAEPQLRSVDIDGVPSLDPKQVVLPEAWRQYPVYRVGAGDRLTFRERQRGNSAPAPDRISVARELWLDFTGEALTARDRISGSFTRSTRLEAHSSVTVGRVEIEGVDQPVTRLTTAAAPGFEVRQNNADINTVSRTPWLRELPAIGWATDVQRLGITLHLPPGWKLLHAGGADNAAGAWLSRWSLWDFFFVLITVLSVAKLFGIGTAVLTLFALALSWHVPGAPHFAWLAILGCHALARALPDGRFQRLAKIGRWASLALVAVILLPYAISEVRLALYPSLERPWQALASYTPGQAGATAPTPQSVAPKPAAAPAAARMADLAAGSAEQTTDGPVAPPPPAEADVERKAKANALVSESVDLAKTTASTVAERLSRRPEKSSQRYYDTLDPSARIPTGPGVPAWRWQSHGITWSGPVTHEQTLTLYLLPPAAHAVLRVLVIALLVALLLALAGRWPRWRGQGAGTGISGLAIMVLVGGLAQSPEVDAAPAAKASAPSASTAAGGEGSFAPSPALLDELVARLTAPPDCHPGCANVAQLILSGGGSRLSLGLEVHALADVYLPLPSASQDWRVLGIHLGGKAAPVRRDANGAWLVAVPRGVHQLTVEADVGTASQLSLALPMSVRAVRNSAAGWSLSGLDARGVPAGALSLSRQVDAGSVGEGGADPRASFAPFVRIHRHLRLGLRWQIETRVERLGASRLPITVRVPLLKGETVLDPTVRVDDGFGQLQLGDQASQSFTSDLAEQANVQLTSSNANQQIEVWQVEASPQWHVLASGIPPVLDQGGPAAPVWRAWPGESFTLTIQRPISIDGATLTEDRTALTVTPGQRETLLASESVLRTSQAATHRIQLTDGARLSSVQVDGQVQLAQLKDNALSLQIAPGTHVIRVDWREPGGMGTVDRRQHLAGPASAANLFTTMNLPRDRLVLWVGGDGHGPAVLFWGVLLVVLAVCYGLARSQLTPLNFTAWALLCLGLIQGTVGGALLVGGLFMALQARRRFAERLTGWRFNAVQLGLGLWAIAATGVLVAAIHGGLLGYPDLLVQGNGSSSQTLNWYVDQASAEPATVHVVSVSVWVYRGAMLLWALWLASSLLKWMQWGWGCVGEGGYWRRVERKTKSVSMKAAGSGDAKTEAEKINSV